MKARLTGDLFRFDDATIAWQSRAWLKVEVKIRSTTCVVSDVAIDMVFKLEMISIKFWVFAD